MHSEPRIELEVAQISARRQWLAFGWVAACVAAVLLVFNQTFFEMVRIWNRSETFTHGFLVLPAFFYFVWQRRAELAVLPVRPSVPAVVLLAAAGFLWLLGEVASALTPGFFAMVAMVPLVISGVLGRQWATQIAFPLAFLFFAVPFGEAFVPTLVEWTADFTVAALQFSGVPVFREGQDLTIPSGRWSVVEACSGIRYLLASVFVGSIYAWTMYRSPMRRLVFLGASVVVPIVANWLRAYLIVMLGHLSGNRIAVGVDHLIYGWIFFGFVIVLLFAVGAIWREDVMHAGRTADGSGTTSSIPSGDAGSKRMAIAAATVACTLLVWPLVSILVMQPYPHREMASLRIQPANGWQMTERVPSAWRPHLQSPAREQVLAFEKGAHRVGVFIGLFRDQRQNAELVNSLNVFVRSDDLKWSAIDAGHRNAQFIGRPLRVQQQVVRGADETVLIWQWYWSGGTFTSSDTEAKLRLALDRLRRRDDTSAWIAVYVVDPASAEAGRAALASFLVEMGAAIDLALNEVAGP